MRALTVTQPWAALIAHGIKRVENRTRAFAPKKLVGQQFAIHAGRKVDRDVLRDLGNRGYKVGEWLNTAMVTSAVVAVATLRGVVDISDWPSPDDVRSRFASLGIVNQDHWTSGPVCYLLSDIRLLPTPVPAKGMLGFWTLPADVERGVLAP